MSENTKKFKVGDLVTVQLPENNQESNVFIIDNILNDLQYAVHHPLCPDIHINKLATELDVVTPAPKSQMQRQLEFTLDLKKHLGPDDVADLEALCMFFVVNRRLTNRQKQILSTLGGKVASEHCIQDLDIALRIVRDNKALLDDFNRMWFANFHKIFAGQREVTSKRQRSSIFNMTGFILAQLHDKHYL